MRVGSATSYRRIAPARNTYLFHVKDLNGAARVLTVMAANENQAYADVRRGGYTILSHQKV